MHKGKNWTLSFKGFWNSRSRKVLSLFRSSWGRKKSNFKRDSHSRGILGSEVLDGCSRWNERFLVFWDGGEGGTFYYLPGNSCWNYLVKGWEESSLIIKLTLQISNWYQVVQIYPMFKSSSHIKDTVKIAKACAGLRWANQTPPSSWHEVCV